MGRQVQEFRPNVVLSTAIYSGLAALVNLAYKRKNGQTIKFYKQIDKLWETVRRERRADKYQGSHDFSSVQKIESILRNLYLKMIWKSTRQYGNKEFKRVYSWREGTVGPLNALLNFAGAVLRDILVPRYPFPDPDLYEIREFPDGRKKILTKKVADKIPPEKKVKSYIRTGYRGNSKCPRVLLTHPTLPALDFGDMIRAHVVELCRQCFIYNVPRSDSQRYIRLLVHRLIPYLDWVYTQGKTGRKDFYPGADKELRKIVLEIRAHFGTESRISEGISRQIEHISKDIGVAFLIEKIETILETSQEDYTRERCKTILNHIEDGIITDIEISKFIEEVTQKTQREGNDWHRVLLSGFAHPRSLREVVFAGDSLLQTPSGVQYLAEIPVQGKTGTGKIDLALFARIKRSTGNYIWTPVLILEIKTKTGFNFNLYGKKPRTKRPNVFTPVLHAWNESLTKTEWTSMIESIPPQSHLAQLDAYETTLLSEYNTLIGDVLKLKRVWKGVVTLDVTQSYKRTKMAFDQLIEQLADRLTNGEFNGEWKTLKLKDESKDKPAPRVAITMAPTAGEMTILKRIIPPKTIDLEDPFSERVVDDVFFTQYISVSSPTSSGKSAAWLAKNWHLLNHLSELQRSVSSGVSLYWIDLLGDYPTTKLTHMRFDLDQLRKNGFISRSVYSRLSGLLNQINFVNLQEETSAFLIDNESSGIERIHEKLEHVLNNQQQTQIVIVDGWADYRRMVPIKNRNNLQILEQSLVQVMKERVQEVIWIDDGVNHPLMNKTYQRSCLNSLSYSSPRRQVVDEILWNLPTAPRKMGGVSPQYEDSRVIIQDFPTKLSPWTTVIQIPYLRGWTRKFSAASTRSPIIRIEQYFGDINQQQNMYGRSFKSSSIQVQYDAIGKENLDSVKEQALTLIPNLGRRRKKQKNSKSNAGPSLFHTVDSAKIQPSLVSRLHLDVGLPPPSPNRLSRNQDIYVEAEDITRGWIHKEVSNEDDMHTITRRPSKNYLPSPVDIDSLDTRRKEILRIAAAVKYLYKKTSSYRSLFDEISSLCNYGTSESGDEVAFLTILIQIKEALLRQTKSRRLWTLLLDSRWNLEMLLNVDDRQSLRQAKTHNPDLVELYGMNLFLAVLSVNERVLKDVESPLSIDLWSIVARWQFYQMGFEQEKDTFQQRYDFQTIYSNLIWRAKQMKKMAPTGTTKFAEHFGQLLWKEGSEGSSIWLLFPSFKNTMYGGFLEDQMSAFLRHGWYRCVIDPQQTRIEAADALSREGWEEMPIVIVEVNKRRVLFMKIEGEDGEEWALAGAFEYGNPPRNKILPVRWVNLSHPLPETLLALHGYQPGSPPADINDYVDRVLHEAAAWSGTVREVTCFLTLDNEKKLYRINLFEGSKSIARKETSSTDEVIRFLKYPQRKGEYFSTSDGTYLKWDPLKDIEYDEVMIKDKDGKRESFNLSVFKPLIHRSSFYPDSYILPANCVDYFGMKSGEDLLLRIRVDEKLKDLHKRKYLKVHFDGLKKRSRFTEIENEDMGIFDVALLAECGQFLDLESNLKHDFTIEAESLVNLRVAHMLADYSQLHDTILAHIDELEAAEEEEADEEFEEDWNEEHEFDQPDEME